MCLFSGWNEPKKALKHLLISRLWVFLGFWMRRTQPSRFGKFFTKIHN